jgi:hypothetical protein
MWSLTSPRTNRISGPKNFRSLVKKGFFNTICQKQTCALAEAPPLLWGDYAAGKVNDFHFAPESGHRAMQSACPFRAKWRR